jgi:hypothetical protein
MCGLRWLLRRLQLAASGLRKHRTNVQALREPRRLSERLHNDWRMVLLYWRYLQDPMFRMLVQHGLLPLLHRRAAGLQRRLSSSGMRVLDQPRAPAWSARLMPLAMLGVVLPFVLVSGISAASKMTLIIIALAVVLGLAAASSP